jgi:flagellin FlaB
MDHLDVAYVLGFDIITMITKLLGVSMVSRSWRIISNIHKHERGMTGLETAIILIAFVTVAAVFGYAILSAGLFSAERAKETVYAGLNEAKSNVEISGSVTAVCDNNTTYAKKIFFNLKNAIAGNPIDMTPCDGTSSAQNKCVISLSTKNDYFSNVKWTGTWMGNNNGNNLLETGEQIEIFVDMDDLGSGNTLSSQLAVNDVFNIQVKPAIGSTVTIQRTLPAALTPAMDLH